MDIVYGLVMLKVHTLAQDFHWCLNTPSLLSGPPLDFGKGCAELETPDALLNALPQRPEITALEEYRQHHGRVGLYYEALWAFLLKHVSGESPILHNAQIFFRKQTLGALDLVSCQGDQLIHRELAAKFYLAAHEGATLDDWIGPHAGDRLSDKVHHLLSHQLPLFYHAETERVLDAWLKSQGQPPLVNWKRRSRIRIQGCLFRHWLRPLATDLPPLINRNQITGLWCHFNELEACLAHTQASGGQIIPRLNWLCGLPNEGPGDFKQAGGTLIQEVTAHMAQAGAGGLMIRLYRIHPEKPEWLHERLIIVPEGWPLRPSAHLDNSSARNA